MEDDDDGPPELEVISDDECPDEEEAGQIEARFEPEPEPELGPFLFGEIAKGLFLGTAQATHQEVLSQLGITHVLSIGEDRVNPATLDPSSPIVRKLTPTTALPGTQYEYEDCNIQFMVLAVEDNPQTALLNHMHGCFAFITSALKAPNAPPGRNKVMIACSEGKSASVTLMASYLIVEEKKTLANVMGIIRDVHPGAEPNTGFARHLRYLDRNPELPAW
eukprot:CAMPEP_0198205968 /NCGR_PEP_ID=MMETSP1445-20131203/9495_1 /TAXON_ID=36898 /ORGANISM="Pyramimonas sp., Strain CCMP2087" /LENGTH=219 /DNA_ID=CAMNT_0043878473 /DNA_START=221 /DNA_END=877 /DNA_ORIENTATION=+